MPNPTVPTTFKDAAARVSRAAEHAPWDAAFWETGMNNGSCSCCIGVNINGGALHNDPNYRDGNQGDPSSWTLITQWPALSSPRVPVTSGSIGLNGYNNNDDYPSSGGLPFPPGGDGLNFQQPVLQVNAQTGISAGEANPVTIAAGFVVLPPA